MTGQHWLVDALSSSDPAIRTDLADRLAATGWDALRSMGIDERNYGAVRVLARQPGAARDRLLLFGEQDRHVIALESLGAAMPRRYAELGIEEASIGCDRVRSALEAALGVLDLVPEAAHAVRVLVRAVHVIATDGPDYDRSYSDPAIPFSIFVGIHPEPVRDEAMRLAEGLVHEAMHLELSLAEALVPMVEGSDERWLSPWQGRPRPVQGLLHGLYVFRAIGRFWGRVLDVLQPDDDRRTFAAKRVAEIEREVLDSSDFVASAELTKTGRALAQGLIAGSGAGRVAGVGGRASALC
ncbi:MAG: hypothetical protein JWR80_6005 [Bradyrhizobium sp.]|nr:hypothetical protein [Bradyrhizobium sp.]